MSCVYSFRHTASPKYHISAIIKVITRKISQEGLIKFSVKALKKRRGFTLIEVLIDFMIISMVAVAIVSGYTAAFKSINLAKAKMVAVTLSNERMEMIRNMPYDDLATERGSIYPVGDILDDETVSRNGITFNVHTVISYVDDPFDGNSAGSIAGKPKDLYPYDYKKVEIVVGKSGRNSQLAKFVTNISAKAAETPSDTGILNFCVIDNMGNPVSSADVLVTNSVLVPEINISMVTADDGCLLIPKLPPDQHNNYHIVVSKNGYSSSQTYPRTSQNPNALQPDVDIIVQQVTGVTLVIDRLSTMEIRFTNQSGAPVAGVTFLLEGSKMTYNNPDTFKYSQTLTADDQGYVKISNLEFDEYKIKNVSKMNLISTSPMQAIKLLPSVDLAVTAMLSDSNTTPSIYNILPESGIVGDAISITVSGKNFDTGAGIKLVNQSSGVEISGTNVEVTQRSKLVADFTLVGASAGIYDVRIINANGESVSQISGFSIINPQQ